MRSPGARGRRSSREGCGNGCNLGHAGPLYTVPATQACGQQHTHYAVRSQLHMQQSPYQPVTQFSLFPPVIKNLLILNGLFFLAQQVPSTNSLLTEWLALWPLGSGGPTRMPDGSLFDLAGFWPWQVLTYAFLHGNFSHILFNMFALWMFGVQIENVWGSRRFAIYYFICVVGAGIIQLFVATAMAAESGVYPTVGASGGVFGILLAFGMMFPERYIMLLIPPIPIKAKWFVIFYGALELFFGVSGLSPGVAHFAHLGGMLFGFVLIQYWRGKLPVEPKQRMYF